MAKLKLVIHPLFFVYGLYFSAIGKVFSFIAFLVTALVHEFGHYLVSVKCGYELNRIVLMPYGAVLGGEMSAFSYSDEIKIAFAGPLINLGVVVFFAAMWWLIPDCYPYTELVVTANLVIGAVNLLPCYPLDGGRILTATLSLYIKRKTAMIIAKIVGAALSFALLGLFVYSCFTAINISLLFFALFVAFGLKSSDNNRYIRALSALNEKSDKRVREVKRYVVSDKTLVKELFTILSANCLCELVVVDYRGNKKTLPYESVQRLLVSADVYSTIKSAITPPIF